MRFWSGAFTAILLIGAAIPSYASTPLLTFSDLTSGPKSGWSAAEPTKGAAVTVWGRNLGTNRGLNYVSVGAVNLTDNTSYAEWGVSDVGLVALQRITFWLDNTMADGLDNITVTVGGVISNAVPFTIRTGSIYFVMSTGSDSNNGSYEAPWATLPKARQAMGTGGTVYVGNNVPTTARDDYNAVIVFKDANAPNMPQALVAYPGATPIIDSTGANYGIHFYPNGKYITVSKFRVFGMPNGMRTGWRYVGNYFEGSTAEMNGSTGAIEGQGDNLVILGNEFYDIGFHDNVGGTPYNQFHVIYLSGARTGSSPRLATESNREVAWNYFHDCYGNRAVNVYSEQTYSALMTNHKVHHNLIINQRGDGIMLSDYVAGSNWVYNNTIIHSGLGTFNGSTSGHAGITIKLGNDYTSDYAEAYVYNNTIYHAGIDGADSTNQTGGLQLTSASRYTLHMGNNIIVADADPYITANSTFDTTGDYHNIYYGNGSPPAWDNGAINLDPAFFSIADNDARLTVGSPAIDNGVTPDAEALVTDDFLGVSRPQGAAFDIGAYEGAGWDQTPSAFSYSDQTGVALGSTNNSDNVTVAGIDNQTTLVLTGDASCKYSINGAAWATADDNVTVGDNVALQSVAAGTYSTAVSCTLNLGGVTDTWSRTTLAATAAAVPQVFRGGNMGSRR